MTGWEEEENPLHPAAPVAVEDGSTEDEARDVLRELVNNSDNAVGDTSWSRRTSSASTGTVRAPGETEDLYCDDELTNNLENNPNMQFSFAQETCEVDAVSHYPRTPMLPTDVPDRGKIL